MKCVDSIIISPLQLARGASRRSRRHAAACKTLQGRLQTFLPSLSKNHRQRGRPSEGRRGAVRPCLSGNPVCLALCLVCLCLSGCLGCLSGWLAGSWLCLSGSSLHLESKSTGELGIGTPFDPNRGSTWISRSRALENPVQCRFWTKGDDSRAHLAISCEISRLEF